MPRARRVRYPAVSRDVVDPFGSAPAFAQLRRGEQGKTFQNVDLIGNAIRGSYFFLEYRADFSRTAARRWEFRFAEYVNLAFAVDSWDCGLITRALRTSK
jgi:hypothetical protein